MPAASKAKRASIQNGAQSIQKTYVDMKTQLTQQLTETSERLKAEQTNRYSATQKIEQYQNEINFTKEALDAKIKECDDLKSKLGERDDLVIRLNQRIEVLEEQVSILRRSKMELEDSSSSVEHDLKKEIDTLKISQKNLVNDAISQQQQVSQNFYDMRVKRLESEVERLMRDSPFGSARKLKAYSKHLKYDTKKIRCRKLLEWIKKEIGDDYDDFISEFIGEVAKDPSCSFATVMSDLDCFLAVTKWKMSDHFLRDFKSLVSSRLGFDIFTSRKKIDQLRKVYGGELDYKITATTIEKKIGSRDVTVESAVIQAIDVADLVRKRLERLSQNGLLKFKDENDAVILGIGGDKGGQSTKLVVSFGNVDTPNNPHGLLLLGLYEGSDDYKGLRDFMLPLFSMINSLTSITYHDGSKDITRPVFKFPVGDCKWLSAILGHSGQSCGTPCFLCDMPWTYKGKNAARLRTFDFSEAGSPYQPADLKEPLLRFDHDKVCPPSLHIILGLVQYYVLNWFFALCNKIDCNDDELPENLNEQRKTLDNLQEQEDFYRTRYGSHKAVLELANEMIDVLGRFRRSGKTCVNNIVKCGSKFCFLSASNRKFVTDPDQFECEKCHLFVHNICALELDGDAQPEKCIDCSKKGEVTLDRRELILQRIIRCYEQDVENDEDVLENLLEERMKLGEVLKEKRGDMRKTFEETLRSIGCDIRTWYQQLTGNQARNLLRPESIPIIISTFPPESSDKLLLMEQVMRDLGTIMSSSGWKEMNADQMKEVESALENFEMNLKEAQPSAIVTPKLHLLCSHLVPYLKKNRSWGLLSEQGLEHFHAIINSFHMKWACVRSPVRKATLTVKALSNLNFLYDSGHSWFVAQ